MSEPLADEPIVIERRKLFEQVAAHLERDILLGKLRPGDRLPPERELQAKFGVGRPAIREALITLQQSGLVEIGNGAPARVAMPSAQDIVSSMIPAVQQILINSEGQRQLQGVRLFVEIGLVRQAARSATDDDLAKLRAALEENRKTIGDRAGFIRTDVSFHFVFAEIIRNPTFIALHHAMSTWLLRQRQIALQEPGEDKRSFEAHCKIYEAVSAHDPDAAEAAMRDHLNSGWVAFWKWFEQNGENASS
jgi:GntR family transcriptional regulator, sialic acid-inducible nan operon repressor